MFGNGDIGIHLDCDGDCRSLAVDLIRLEDGLLPALWWERRIPRVVLGLREVAELLAPQTLNGESDLSPLSELAQLSTHLRCNQVLRSRVQRAGIGGRDEVVSSHVNLRLANRV